MKAMPVVMKVDGGWSGDRRKREEKIIWKTIEDKLLSLNFTF